MNLDDEVGGGEWLGPGRYVGFIRAVKATITRQQNPCVEFLVECIEGRQTFRLMLLGKCLWTWRRLASNVGIPKEDREDWPLDFDATDLNRLRADGRSEQDAKKESRIVITDSARLGWMFMTKPVGIVVTEKQGDRKKFVGVDETFKPSDDEVTAARLGLENDDDIPF